MEQNENKMYYYHEFARQFDRHMNMYETNRRLEIIFNQLVSKEEIEGSKLLDAGCGTGWFSKKACELGANVTSMDLGGNLMEQVKEKCNATMVTGSVLDMPFEENTFDVIINTEVIEHTPYPQKAVSELSKVLKPDGLLILTVPNKIWKWSVLFANTLKFRPYQGYENWPGFFQLKRWLNRYNLVIEHYYGFNLIPILNKTTMPINKIIDKAGNIMGLLMINIAVRARKLK